MKNLVSYIKESILGTTNSGKMYFAKQWIMDNAKNTGYGKNEFDTLTLDNKGRINFNEAIDLRGVDEQIPQIVTFGNIRDFWTCDLKYITKEQMPLNAYRFNCGKLSEIYDLDITTCIFDFTFCKFSKFNNITLHKIKDSSLFLANIENLTINAWGSNINEKMIQEIHCDEVISYINLHDTPLGKKILRTFKKMTNEELTDYCNRVFGNIPKLERITLSINTSLKHDLKTNTWHV